MSKHVKTDGARKVARWPVVRQSYQAWRRSVRFARRYSSHESPLTAHEVAQARGALAQLEVSTMRLVRAIERVRSQQFGLAIAQLHDGEGWDHATL